MIATPRFSPVRVAALSLVALAVAAMIRPAAAQAQTEIEPPVSQPSRTYVAADYSYVPFQDDLDPWHLTSVSLGHRTSRGSIIGRANHARRFAISGVQVEADAYPRLTRYMYGYLNVGYSDASIFPDWRFGGELFANLPHAWEASAGFRQLRFGGPHVTLYTGSLGKYVGNYWVSLRPFVRSKENGASTSASLTARRYFADADHYVGARVGYGSSPSDRITPQDIERINSFSAGLHGSGGPWTKVIATWSAGYDREELAPGQIRRSWPVSAGLMLIF